VKAIIAPAETSEPAPATRAGPKRAPILPANGVIRMKTEVIDSQESPVSSADHPLALWK
jgi:hypothetical protein